MSRITLIGGLREVILVEIPIQVTEMGDIKVQEVRVVREAVVAQEAMLAPVVGVIAVGSNGQTLTLHAKQNCYVSVN